MLNQGNRRADRGVGIYVADIQVCRAGEPLANVNDISEQLEKNRRWLLKRQRHDRLLDIVDCRLKVNELTGAYIDLAAADTALELEAALHVGECSRIKEGAQRSGRSFSETADDVVEAEAVEAQAGQELVADKPVPASLLLVL